MPAGMILLKLSNVLPNSSNYFFYEIFHLLYILFYINFLYYIYIIYNFIIKLFLKFLYLPISYFLDFEN